MKAERMLPTVFFIFLITSFTSTIILIKKTKSPKVSKTQSFKSSKVLQTPASLNDDDFEGAPASRPTSKPLIKVVNRKTKIFRKPTSRPTSKSTSHPTIEVFWSFPELNKQPYRQD